MKKLFSTMIQEALQQDCTDLHFQSQYQPQIIMRQRGQLFPFKTLPLATYQKFLVYLQYLANIDLNHPKKPQTGSFTWYLNNQPYYFRLSYLPSHQDLHMVLRILNHHHFISLEDLSQNDEVIQIFLKLLKKEAGMIVVCGPTGSGKSTTLHAFIDAIIKRHNKCIITIEDPIEIYQKGIVQIQIDGKELNFNNTLKQVLRHDPDVIMLGEIRDEISAQLALRLALTGHLVLTTLHAKNVQTSLTRLMNLGIGQDDLGECLQAIISQRLLYNPQPLTYFEIATHSQLNLLLTEKKISFLSLEEILQSAQKRGELSEEIIEAYLET